VVLIGRDRLVRYINFGNNAKNCRNTQEIVNGNGSQASAHRCRNDKLFSLHCVAGHGFKSCSLLVAEACGGGLFAAHESESASIRKQAPKLK